MKKIYILGGSIDHSIAQSSAVEAMEIQNIFNKQLKESGLESNYETKLILINTSHNDPNVYNSVDNQNDLQNLLNKIVEQKDTRVLVQCMTIGKNVIQTESEYFDVLKKVRQERKDIFTIALHNSINKDNQKQYSNGLELLKQNSLNLLLAHDMVSQSNMIIAPEETIYCHQINNRNEVLKFLVKMTVSRIENKFTRSTVVEGNAIDWNSELVPNNLRAVVNHCIEHGAYKPFLGKTAGHFAVKVNEGEILTSIRKTNFNHLDTIGLVKVESKNDNEVIAHGFRPSVGGQSQRIIFKEHPDLDCIVHFHCPVKSEFKDIVVPVKEQWPNECGSHQCGKNTSDGLKEIDVDGHKISVVYLDEHGPNIVFNKNVPSEKVINFIDKYFDLSQKTGGIVMTS